MSGVLLVTCAALPEGEPGHQHLDRVLAARGIPARWVVWDDPGVDWAAADLVAVRATWDYDQRVASFLAWARDAGPRLLNGSDVFEWNTDKAYLVTLAEAGLPVVPTRVVDAASVGEAALAEWGACVVKPRVGAGGRGVTVVEPGSLWPSGPGADSIVQPLVPSVRTEGETSVFVLGGHAVSQVVKVPGGDEIRVHEEYGGHTRPADLDPAAAALAEQAIASTASLLAADISYGRVDLLHHADEWVVSELELTEPGLYLDVLPRNAEHFADVVDARLP